MLKTKIKTVLTNRINKSTYKDSNNINYDLLFNDLDTDLLSYFKNENLLSEYVKFKNNGYSESDTRWHLLNVLKLRYENEKGYRLANVLYKMGRQLYVEKRFEEAELYLYSNLYCLYLTRGIFELGTVRIRDIKNQKEKITYEKFECSILEIIPNTYNKKKVNECFNMIIEQLNNENK